MPQPKMKDRSSQRSISSPVAKHVDKTLGIAASTRSDYGNIERFRNCTRKFTIETGPRAIAIHRGQQDFSGAALFGLACPGKCIAASSSSAAVRIGLALNARLRCITVDALSVDSND